MKPKITFNSENWNKETPKFIKTIYRALGALTAFWLMAIEPRMPGLSLSVKYAVLTYSVGGNYAIYYFCQYFGYQQPEAPPGTQPFKQQMNEPASIPEKTTGDAVAA